MTSCALRPARRARNAPALWMPSCESPARRMTASLIFSGRRSARSEAGVVEGTAAAVPRRAVGSSLLFGAAVSGVVEGSFTRQTPYQKCGAIPPEKFEDGTTFLDHPRRSTQFGIALTLREPRPGS